MLKAPAPKFDTHFVPASVDYKNAGYRPDWFSNDAFEH
jgi:hypothetical protein